MNLSIRRLLVAATVFGSVAGAGVNYAYETDAVPAERGLRLVLNLAGNRLRVYEDGEHTRTYKVSVGLPQYRTPAGEYRIHEVTWNPWWHPPSSEWARGRKPEPPGPSNPMGRVKLQFAPLLYIHGTADWQSLGQPASHGCVRMRNSDAIELARLVHRYASPEVDEELLDRLESSPTMTRRIRLADPVELSVQYDVATVDDGFLVIYPDHYGLREDEVREAVLRTLEEHGVERREVHRERLDRLVKKSATRRVVMSLDSIGARVSVGDSRER